MNDFVSAHLIWLLGMIPLTGAFFAAFYAIGAPFRRQERARFFLDLIETGLRQGESAERTIVSISKTGDRSIGVHFHLLAAHLESGWRLVAGLNRVKRLLPPQIMATLGVGDEIGDLHRILPACRLLLKDAASRTQGAYNYLIVLVFVLVPVVPALFWILSEIVFPRLAAVFASVLDTQVDVSLIEFAQIGAEIAKVQIVLALFLWCAAILYVGGPRMVMWIESGLSFSVADRVACWIPWKMKRLQRDFSAVLAILLDAEVPEERAVQLAAEATANRRFVRRGEEIIRRLKRGIPLPEAVTAIDRSGEFQWRLRNALHTERRFFAALRGWLEHLDAKAYQQEQATAQLLTTGLVVFNGVMVAMFTVFVFRGLSLILDAAVLW